MGLIQTISGSYVGPMDKFIFIHGDANVIYSDEEIKFIKTIDNIIVFPDFIKQTRNGNIPCRSIAVTIENNEFIRTAIAFEKIMNKATDGFNIFFIITNNALLFGCNTLGSNKKRDYELTPPIKDKEKYLEIEQNLIFAPESEYFMDFYYYVHEIFGTPSAAYNTYRGAAAGRYYYLDLYEYLLQNYSLDISPQIRKYENTLLEDAKPCDFNEVLEDEESSLFKIESSRVNTLEMLFEAEEAEKLAIENEKKNESIYMKEHSKYATDSKIEDNATKLLSDPEMLIKMLKREKGLI